MKIIIDNLPRRYCDLMANKYDEPQIKYLLSDEYVGS